LGLNPALHKNVDEYSRQSNTDKQKNRQTNISALEVNFNVMHSINSHFTYLLTSNTRTDR